MSVACCFCRTMKRGLSPYIKSVRVAGEGTSPVSLMGHVPSNLPIGKLASVGVLNNDGDANHLWRGVVLFV
jgi:hypothetical protein